MKSSFLEGIDRAKREEQQTAERKQKLFKEVVKSNAEMFASITQTHVESFCYNAENVRLFINLNEDDIRNLAVDFFRLQLAKQTQEYSERYLTARTNI